MKTNKNERPFLEGKISQVRYERMRNGPIKLLDRNARQVYYRNIFGEKKKDVGEKISEPETF